MPRIGPRGPEQSRAARLSRVTATAALRYRARCCSAPARSTLTVESSAWIVVDI